MFNIDEYIETNEGVGPVIDRYISDSAGNIIYEVMVRGSIYLKPEYELSHYNPYKVGDKVKIVSEIGKLNYWGTTMKTAIGTVGTVKDTHNGRVLVDIGDDDWYFHVLEVEPYIEYNFKEGDRVKVVKEYPHLEPKWNYSGQMDNTIGKVGTLTNWDDTLEVVFDDTSSWLYHPAELELIEPAKEYIKLYKLFEIYNDVENRDRVFKDNEGYEYYFNKEVSNIRRRTEGLVGMELTNALYTDDMMRIEVYEI